MEPSTTMHLTLLTLFCICTAKLYKYKDEETDRYCDQDKYCINHTMCKYSVHRACDHQILYEGLSGFVQVYVIYQHNFLRNKVAAGKETGGLQGKQPPSSAMKDLVWNDELATFAQLWAFQCTVQTTDECRNLEDMEVNQLIHIVNEPSVDPVYIWKKTLNEEWYQKSLDLFDADIVPSYRDTEYNTTSYTQLVWGNTSIFGCGYIREILKGGKMKDIMVCNYAPAGNVVGEPVYKIGPYCTECEPGEYCTTRFPSLCAGSDSYAMLNVQISLLAMGVNYYLKK